MFDIFDNRENKFISNKSYNFVWIKNYYFIFSFQKVKKNHFVEYLFNISLRSKINTKLELLLYLYDYTRNDG